MVTAAAAGKASGKEARARASRSSHAVWEPAPDRLDPVEKLTEEAGTRVPELVPIRHARMATSEFAFFRGAAGIMAADLAGTPSTGLTAQLCGDAHLSNFGGFASPERSLVFDLNDFDETLPGPWEWDLKRLATSLAIAARDRGFADQELELATRTATEYRLAMRRFAGMPALEVWYARIDESELAAALHKHMSAREVRRFDRNAAKARSKDSTRAFGKLTYTTNGRVRIAADPPLITPVEDLAPHDEAERINDAMAAVVARYAETLPRERRRLLDRYEYVHAARKVVGVGSVGTRAWVLLLVGCDHGDPLFLQAKEAGRSVLEPYTAPCEYDNQGQRVVEGQRLVQAAGDIFLGWVRAEGVDGQERDFYVRQLWDWKTAAEVERMSARGLLLYAELCAWTLARAHARTGDARAIAGYLGGSEKFDRAIGSFAQAYADQNERDYSAFVDAISDGRIDCAPSPLK
jgi:uncharacterized protein (DUF2252 family)